MPQAPKFLKRLVFLFALDSKAIKEFICCTKYYALLDTHAYTRYLDAVNQHWLGLD